MGCMTLSTRSAPARKRKRIAEDEVRGKHNATMLQRRGRRKAEHILPNLACAGWSGCGVCADMAEGALGTAARLPYE